MDFAFTFITHLAQQVTQSREMINPTTTAIITDPRTPIVCAEGLSS